MALDSVSIDTLTWGRFLERLRELGASVEELDDGRKYVMRRVHHSVRIVELPVRHGSKDLVGRVVFYRAVRTLEFEKDRDFPRWYLAH